MAKEYVFEFGGGLGDVLFQMYDRNIYNVLDTLGPDDSATVWLICANPFAYELFTKHPNADRIKVRDMGYWGVEQDAENRRKHNMPAPGSNRFIPSASPPVKIYPTEADSEFLQTLEPGYLVVAAGAGLNDRVIPPVLLETVVRDFLELCPTRQLVFAGRTFDRCGERPEPRPFDHPRLIDGVDKLTVPGTVELVRRSAGLITSHSALNLLGWLEHKPQLLLYPQSVLDRHCHKGKYDQWMFGAEWYGTVHGLFDRYDPSWLRLFVKRGGL